MTFAPLLTPLLAMLGAGLLAGFAAGIFGIGGGFVVVPALVLVLPLLGGDPTHLTHVAIATSMATIIVTATRATYAQAKRGAVDFGVLKSWAPWIVLGVVGGTFLADRVDGAMLAVIFGCGVSIMSLHFLFPALTRRQLASQMPSGVARAGIAGGLGAFSSLLGIGGGIIVTITMTLCGNSIHRAIATGSGMGIIISIPSVIGFMLIGQGHPGLPFGSVGYVNFPAALLIASTSILTAPLGVAAAHKLSPAVLRPTLGVYLLFVGTLMITKGLQG